MSSAKIPEGYYTVAQAAKAVHLSTSNFRYHIKHGHVDVIDVNPGTEHFYQMISQEALDAFRRKREGDIKADHLYEIICIVCGETSVLYSTHNLKDLSMMYIRFMERDNKLVRIRKDGVVLKIWESDQLGNICHPRIKKGQLYGEELERSQRDAEGALSRHEQGGVLHGEEPEAVRRGAYGPGSADRRRGRLKAGKPKEPVPAVSSGGSGDAQGDPSAAERAERAGVSSRPGKRQRLTDEERKLKRREQSKRWRQNNLEKARALDRAKYWKNRDKELARAKKYAQEHPERVREASRKCYYKKKEAAKNGLAAEGQ